MTPPLLDAFFASLASSGGKALASHLVTRPTYKVQVHWPLARPRHGEPLILVEHTTTGQDDLFVEQPTFDVKRRSGNPIGLRLKETAGLPREIRGGGDSYSWPVEFPALILALQELKNHETLKEPFAVRVVARIGGQEEVFPWVVLPL